MLRTSATVVLATVVAIGAWLAWLGFHAPYSTVPDTSRQTGPYEPWQVVGLALCLLVAVVVAARLGVGGAAVAGTVTGLALVASADWGTASNADGLWVIGVGTIVLHATPAGLLVTLLVRPRRTLHA